MVNKNQLLRRLLVLGCVLLLCFGLAGGQLVQQQLWTARATCAARRSF